MWKIIIYDLFKIVLKTESKFFVKRMGVISVFIKVGQVTRKNVAKTNITRL